MSSSNLGLLRTVEHKHRSYVDALEGKGHFQKISLHKGIIGNAKRHTLKDMEAFGRKEVQTSPEITPFKLELTFQ